MRKAEVESVAWDCLREPGPHFYADAFKNLSTTGTKAPITTLIMWRSGRRICLPFGEQCASACRAGLEANHIIIIKMIFSRYVSLIYIFYTKCTRATYLS